jgi:hypothetical protein
MDKACACVVSVTIVVIATLLIAVAGGRANLGLVLNAGGSLVLATGAGRLRHVLATGAVSTNLVLAPKGIVLARFTRGIHTCSTRRCS